MIQNPIQQYALVTANYWAFTVTDGALRMLVLLFFYQLGYSPLELAFLFLFYEFFGIVTNLFGGWLATRMGLKLTMNVGLLLQVVALLMLTVSQELLTVFYVMCAQALSGIAKDLNKMSAKSSIKSLAQTGEAAESRLYHWVALLTGSKNALKGVGFFVGAWLLASIGFVDALYSLAALLVVVLALSVLALNAEMGKAKSKVKFSQIFSKSPAINWLSAARFFLFGARDIWFVVALPVFLASQLEWSHTEIGVFMAYWIIGYGLVQAFTPKLTGLKKSVSAQSGSEPTANSAMKLALVLALIPLMMVLGLMQPDLSALFSAQWIVLIGLSLFGIVFAMNSAVHSYLIVSYADQDGTSKDVGFYYMANAGGRLVGTLLSGLIFQLAGLEAALVVSALFVLVAGLLVKKIG